MAASRISELAALIAANAAIVDGHLASEGLPSPSFSPDTPVHLFARSNITEARQAILEATDELHALMLGPTGILTAPSHNFLLSLQAIYRFELATSFSDEATFGMIAMTSGLGEPLVRRILRHAMTYHVFCEPRKGVVAHTAASKLLAVDPLMHQWIGMVSEEMWPAATKAVEAMEKWPGSEEPNHSGFNLAHNTEEHVFEELSKHPKREERYAAAMTWFNTGPGLEPTYILNGFAWESLGNGVVVDVGGSHGAVCIAIARRFPSLCCIVQDRPEIVKLGRANLSSDLTNRVSFMEHDFFTEQPVKSADVFYFRWILHDWSDKYAIRILKALIPALKCGARIIINEHILPEPGALPTYQERFLREFDLSMLKFHNARERDMGDWINLFHSADSRFKFLGARQPMGSRLGIVEVAWTGDGAGCKES